MFAGREAQSGAPKLAGGGGVRLRKRLEYFFLGLLRYPDSLIDDLETDAYLAFGKGSSLHVQTHRRVIRDFDRIAEQIVQNLPDSTRITDDVLSNKKRSIDLQRHTFTACGEFNVLLDIANKLSQVDRDLFNFKFTCLYFGEVENVIDDRKQRLGRALDCLTELTLFRVEAGG